MRNEVSGYSNYPTFHVALFLANDSRRHELMKHLAQNILEDSELQNDDERRLCLRDHTKELVEEEFLGLTDREEAAVKEADVLAYELLSAAIGQVDWMEIADEWLATAEEEMAAAAGNPS